MITRNCKTCGKEFTCRPSSPKKFCGYACIQKTHGMTYSTEYGIWRQMRHRCHNPRKSDYPLYGGKGIHVCGRWYNSFENFYADMGPRPSMNHTLDRIDGKGNYEPENCRWATRKEQSQNRPGYTYSPEEDAKIREAVALGMNFRQMAAHVGRSIPAVMGRTYRLGLRSGVPPIPKKQKSAQPGPEFSSPHGHGADF